MGHSAMMQLYKPAVCHGQSCDIIYLISYQFDD